MNALSVRFAQSSRRAASRPRAALLAVLALAPLLGAVSATSQAQDQTQATGGDQPIVASLNPPPAGLDCAAAAAATSVYFQFANPPFQVSQISLYLDGKGVAQDAVDEHWPTVTLSKGLHPGSNTVDIVANGASGQHIERRMLVQVGGASDGAAGTAQVACDDAAAAQQPAPQAVDPGAGSWDDQTQYGAVSSEPAPVVIEDSPPVVYDYSPQVVYDYPPPVYVYSPYPVVAFGPWVPFVPFFGFGFFYSHYHPYCESPRFVNGGYYGHGGWNGGGWHGGGSHGGGWNGGPGPGGWHGGTGSGSGPGSGPGGWRGGNPGNGAGNYPAPRPGNGGGPGGGPTWRGQAPTMSQTRGGWQGAPQQAQPSGGQYRGGYNAPTQQFRPAPQQYRPQQQYRPVQQQYRPQQQSYRAAPAFNGGGGGGGRGAPASHGGGGGRHR